MKKPEVPSDVLREYVRVRRKHFDYTQKTFALALDVPLSTYRDFESGATVEMRAGLFARVVDKLKIPIEHVRRLGTAVLTIDEAKKLASEQVAAIEAHARTDASKMTDTELERTLKMFDELKNDPLRYGEWLGYGRRLLEEVSDDSAHDEG